MKNLKQYLPLAAIAAGAFLLTKKQSVSGVGGGLKGGRDPLTFSNSWLNYLSELEEANAHTAALDEVALWFKRFTSNKCYKQLFEDLHQYFKKNINKPGGYNSEEWKELREKRDELIWLGKAAFPVESVELIELYI